MWPGHRGRQYLLDLEAALASYSMTMFVTPGNHDDYDQIDELPTLDLGHEIGAVQWVTDHIALLPRGHRWERNGWSFVSLGGAPSIDRWSRREGIDWWAAEMITDDDVARVVEAGPADVMLTHDAPDAALCTPRVASILRSNPTGWPTYALNYAAEGTARMTTAFLAVEPRLFLHGHFHVKDETWLEQFDHPTHVVSLAGVTPSAPVTEWTLDDVVGVLNRGRSVHWKVLARVARRGDSGFGSLLAEALTLTDNDLARDYLRRVLASEGPGG